jgi:hypothetical protein
METQQPPEQRQQEMHLAFDTLSSSMGTLSHIPGEMGRMGQKATVRAFGGAPGTTYQFEERPVDGQPHIIGVVTLPDNSTREVDFQKDVQAATLARGQLETRHSTHLQCLYEASAGVVSEMYEALKRGESVNKLIFFQHANILDAIQAIGETTGDLNLMGKLQKNSAIIDFLRVQIITGKVAPMGEGVVPAGEAVTGSEVAELKNRLRYLRDQLGAAGVLIRNLEKERDARPTEDEWQRVKTQLGAADTAARRFMEERDTRPTEDEAQTLRDQLGSADIVIRDLQQRPTQEQLQVALEREATERRRAELAEKERDARPTMDSYHELQIQLEAAERRITELSRRPTAADNHALQEQLETERARVATLEARPTMDSYHELQVQLEELINKGRPEDKATIRKLQRQVAELQEKVEISEKQATQVVDERGQRTKELVDGPLATLLANDAGRSVDEVKAQLQVLFGEIQPISIKSIAADLPMLRAELVGGIFPEPGTPKYKLFTRKLIDILQGRHRSVPTYIFDSFWKVFSGGNPEYSRISGEFLDLVIGKNK